MEWYIEDRVDGREIGFRAIVDSEGFTICEPSPMGEANAWLIAAAPKLLKALEGLLADALRLGLADSEYSGSAIEASAAIARAKGNVS